MDPLTAPPPAKGAAPGAAELARQAKAWPFELARKLEARVRQQIEGGKRDASDPVVFETGYGPSGLPHIGTFGEVVRTSMVRRAFEVLTEGRHPTRLICISDDMDGMRKVPPTVPDPDALEPYLQKPLTDVPDPFGTHGSYGAHMNARLRAFLDRFGFEYEFLSATECYRSGRFDEQLRLAARRYDKIMDVMLPTLGEERQATYSPFLPVSPATGRVLYVPMKAVDAEAGTVTFEDEAGRDATVPVTGGHVKLQWKPDFGMRWAALGVDFEMFGKDHQANAGLYSKICRILGHRPPEQYVYELFLDRDGEKISKSKGNGISVDEWLRYAPQESLSLFQFQKPRTAKRLHFDVIPKAVDEYVAHLEAYERQSPAERLENPAWHIHGGDVPQADVPVSYSLLLNLAAAANAQDEDTLWAFIERYAPGSAKGKDALTDELARLAVRYNRDIVEPSKAFRDATEQERAAMLDLAARLEAAGDRTAEALQTLTFSVGKDHGFDKLRDWFKALYEVLLGDSQGPRFGSFAALYGADETAALIRDRLGG